MDAILLDMLMPDMDGFAVLEAMRSYLRWATIPVAIFTAYPEDPRLWHIDTQGVTRIFTKSKATLDSILEWVNEAAERAFPPPGTDLPGTQAGA